MSVSQKGLLEAIDRIKDRVRRHPDERHALLLDMAELYEKAGLHLPATQTLQHVLKEHPLDLKALLMLARNWVLRRDFVRAIQIYHSLEKSLPRLTEAYLGQYACWKRLGRIEAASAALQRLLALRPGERRVRELLVDLLEEGGRIEEAADEVDALLDRHPDPRASTFEWAARLASRAGRARNGIAHLRKALELDPSRSDAWLALARAYEERRDWPGVREAASRLLDLNPSRIEGHRLLGLACLELGEWDRALLALERAGEGREGDGEIRRLTAEALFRSGDHREARRLYQEIAQGEAWNGEVQFRLAQLALEEEDRETARRHLLRALHVSPNLAPAHLLLGEIHMETEEHGQALKVLQKLLLLRPRNLKVHLHLGRTHRLLNNETKARHHLRVASDMAPERPEPWLELARLHRDFSRPALARDLFRRAMDCSAEGSSLHREAGRELRWLEDEGKRSQSLSQTSLPRAVGQGNLSIPRGGKARWRKLC